MPFDAAVATRFVDYYNDTLQSQSTLKVLENPPVGYQKQPFDIMQELINIKAKINSGDFSSQYAFESGIQLLIARMHDNHVTLDAGILSAFRFASPYTLISISEDGLQEPKVYLHEDVLAATKEVYRPSPLSKINNMDVHEYLESLLAMNTDGYVESHGDWNSLMSSPAKEI